MTANNDHPVLVIGGGISGITCALELDRLGVPVVLMEKEAALGGLAAQPLLQGLGGVQQVLCLRRGQEAPGDERTSAHPPPYRGRDR